MKFGVVIWRASIVMVAACSSAAAISLEPPVQAATRNIYKNGTYRGYLKVISVQDHNTESGCEYPNNRNMTFRVRTNGKRIAVFTAYDQFGTIKMTGRHKARSWKAVRDFQKYTFVLNAARVTSRQALVTHAITYWATGSRFCKWTWRGWAYRS